MADKLLKSPEKIVKRLEELRLWQEDQEKKLKDRQEIQRKMLSDEQHKLYELLGLSAISENFTDLSKNSHINDGSIHEYIEDSSVSISTSKFTEDKPDLNTKNKIKSDSKAQKKFSNNQSADLFKTEITIQRNVPKRRFLKRGEGLKSRFKIDPDAFRLNNLPRYKYAGIHRDFKQTKYNQPNGHLRKSCKESANIVNTHNLNLEKSHISSNKKQTQSEVLSAVQSNFQKSTEQVNQDSIDLSVFDSIGKQSENIENNTNKIVDPISWAKVLDPNNIEPTAVESFRDITADESKPNILSEDTDNLSLFELLEQKAHEGSFALDAINIKKWIRNKAKELHEESETLNINTEHMKKTKIQPYPFDVVQKLIPDDTDSNNTSCTEEDFSETESEEETTNYKSVRFAEQIVEFNRSDGSETETIRSIQCNNTTNSTPNFERFKQRLFSVESQNDESSITDQFREQNDHARKEILEKSELLKERLNEVEIEISKFKASNLELMKMKQDHELDKFRFQQECTEMQEQFKDEKLKFEIYCHDERMKIEEEKRKLEKLIRDQKVPNRKERDEIIKLRETLENVQKDLKTKESNHISAQGRLRAQIRNNEKEMKDLMFEIEHLKRENKKLDSDNARLNRTKNNNMLKEINKTIAKLAPKNSVEESLPKTEIKVSEVRNRNPKQAVAKVFKHVASKENNSLSLASDSSDDTSDHFDRNKSNYSRQYKTKKHHEELVKNPSDNLCNSTNTKEFRREIQNDDGSKEIWYPNGNIKKVSNEGMLTRMLYFNKDIKETNIHEGTVKYYYAETNTWQTSYLDGLEIFEFPSGITERRHKDGTIESYYPNGSVRKTYPNNEEKQEELTCSDGTQYIKFKTGETILQMTNGQKEIRTKVHSRREYPDGTVKFLYPDGSQETRYSNGRVRIKDKNGILVMDSDSIRFN